MVTISAVLLVCISLFSMQILYHRTRQKASVFNGFHQFFPAQAVGKWIQFKLLLDEARQAIYAFTQICAATGNVDFICAYAERLHRRR